MNPTPQQIGGFRIRGQIRAEPHIVLDAVDDQERPVAIKIVRPTGTPEHRAQRIAAFLDMAGRARLVDHVGAARVLGSGEIDDAVYLVIERIKGTTLPRLCEREALDLEAVLSMAIQLADTLLGVHNGGLVARDLHPSNTLVDDDGRPIICALVTTLVTEAAQPDDAAPLLGAPGYVAPEVQDGRRIPWPGSDQFALGRILTEMCQPAARFEPLQPVLARMTAADPAVRYDHMSACIAALVELDPNVAWDSETDQAEAYDPFQGTTAVPYETESAILTSSFVDQSGGAGVIIESLKQRSTELRQALTEHAALPETTKKERPRLPRAPSLSDEFDDRTIPETAPPSSGLGVAMPAFASDLVGEEPTVAKQAPPEFLDDTDDDIPEVSVDVVPDDEPTATPPPFAPPPVVAATAPLMPAVSDKTPLVEIAEVPARRPQPPKASDRALFALGAAMLGFALGLAIIVLGVERLDPKIDTSAFDLPPLTMSSKGRPLFRLRGKRISEVDQNVARRLHSEGLSSLRDTRIAEAERLFGMCIEIADLPECHRELGALLSLMNHPAAATHVRRGEISRTE